MKKIRTVAAVLALALGSISSHAQSVDLTNGDLASLAGQKTINVEFTYNKMGVGEFSKESDYISHKMEEANKKEAGSGDTWAKQWVADRKERYEPKFIETFSKYSEMAFDSTAKYTMILNTSFTEPGYQIGISKKPAAIEGTAVIVETANRNKKVATISIERGGSGMFKGAAFDSASRITEAYGSAAKKIGVLVKKGAK